jgi:hypothetical protein
MQITNSHFVTIGSSRTATHCIPRLGGNTARDDGVFDTGEIYDAVTIPDYIAISVLIVLILMAAARLFARTKP